MLLGWYTHTQDIYIYTSSCASSAPTKNLISHLSFFFSIWFQRKTKIMVDPQSPIPPHLYPQAIQLKLYQAFIFSIPILFSIILFLLFYLFYLKRRASSLSTPSMILPISSTHQSSSYPPSVSVSMSLWIHMQENWTIYIKKY